MKSTALAEKVRALVCVCVKSQWIVFTFCLITFDVFLVYSICLMVCFLEGRVLRPARQETLERIKADQPDMSTPR